MIMKKRGTLFIPVLLCFFLHSCTQEEEVAYQQNECRVQPTFIRSLGFDPARAAFSTSERQNMGLTLLQLQQAGDTGKIKTYQHPSWRMAGWLGPLQLDNRGNCFVAPLAVIQVLDNPPAQQNNIYRVDAQTGEMKLFAKLPMADTPHSRNPYGILGLAYLCESNVLYVSSVAGSTPAVEKGKVFAVDAQTGEVIDVLKDMDVMGLGVSYAGGKRNLYMGSARSSDIYTIALTEKGKFNGSHRTACSITDNGPRGDDKARKIRFDKSGNMQVYGISFNYNLTAPTEKQETLFTFSWNGEEGKWVLGK
jgi:hypothetical protein